MLTLLLGLGIASANAADTGPFQLLEGTEVARSLPLREVGAGLYAWLADGLLAIDEEGPAHLDLRGQFRDRLEVCPGAQGKAVELSAPMNGAWALGRYENGRVCAWEGTALRAQGGGDVQAVALGNSALTAWAYADGRVEGRDPRSGAKKWTRNPELGAVRTLRFERSGPRVVGTAPTGAFVLDTRSGRLVRGLRGPPAFSGAFDPRGEQLAVGRADGKIELWDTAQWYRKALLRFTGGTVVDLDWSPDGAQLAAALERGTGESRTITVEVWDFGVDDLVFREDAPKGTGPARVRFDHSGERLVASTGVASRMWAKPGSRSIPRKLPSDEPPHKRPIDDTIELPPLAVAPTVERLPGLVRMGNVSLARAPQEVVPVANGAPPSGTANTTSSTSNTTGGTPASGIPSTNGTSGNPNGTAQYAGLLVATGPAGTVPLTGSATATAPFVLADDGARAAAWEGNRLAVWDTATGAQIGRVAVAHPRSVALRGARLAVVAEDGKVYAGSLERLRVVPDVANAVVVAIDPFHNDRIGIGLADGTVKVVELGRGTSLGAWGVHAGPVTALAFTPDGARLATAGPPAEAEGARVVVLSAVRSAEPEEPWIVRLDGTVHRLAFSGDRLLAVGDETVAVLDRGRAPALELFAPVADATWDGTAVRWADLRGDIRRIIPGDPLPQVPRGRFLARSADAQWSLTVDGDQVSVWNDRSGRLVRVSPGAGAAVRTAVFERTGARVAVLDAAGSVEVYDVASGEALRHLDAVGAWMRFSDDGTVLWLLASPTEIVGWDIATGQALERVPLAGPAAPDLESGLNRFVQVLPDAWLDTARVSPRRLVASTRPLAVTPDGRRIAVVVDGSIELRTAEGDRRTAVLAVEGDTPTNAGAFTDDGCYLAATYTSGVIRVWEVERPQTTLDGDGQIKSTTLDARRVRVMVTLGADARQLARTSPPRVVSLGFQQEGRVLVSRDASGAARLFEWRLAEEAPMLGTGAGPVLPVPGVHALLAAEGRLYSAWEDGYVRVFQLDSGVQEGMLLGHAGAVTGLAMSADGASLLTGSEDGTVRIWSTATGVEKSALNTFGDPVREVAYSPEAWRAAAVGDDDVVRTWDTTRGKALRRWKVDGDVTGLRAWADRVEATLADGSRWTLYLESGAVGRVDTAPPITPSGGGAPPRNAPPGAAPLDPRYDAARELATHLGPIATELRVGQETWVAADTEGRLQLWDLETASLRGVLRVLSDGSWVVERPDGTRYASESLRDGTSPLLFKPPPQ